MTSHDFVACRYYIMLRTLKPNVVVYNWECTQRSDLEVSAMLLPLYIQLF